MAGERKEERGTEKDEGMNKAKQARRTTEARRPIRQRDTIRKEQNSANERILYYRITNQVSACLLFSWREKRGDKKLKL